MPRGPSWKPSGTASIRGIHPADLPTYKVLDAAKKQAN